MSSFEKYLIQCVIGFIVSCQFLVLVTYSFIFKGRKVLLVLSSNIIIIYIYIAIMIQEQIDVMSYCFIFKGRKLLFILSSNDHIIYMYVHLCSLSECMYHILYVYLFCTLCLPSHVLFYLCPHGLYSLLDLAEYTCLLNFINVYSLNHRPSSATHSGCETYTI